MTKESRLGKVLEAKTILELNRYTELSYRGRNILERWAVNQPEDLKKLEQKGVIILLITVLTQQGHEANILDEWEAQEQIRQGLTEHEVLELHGLDESLHLK